MKNICQGEDEIDCANVFSPRIQDEPKGKSLILLIFTSPSNQHWFSLIFIDFQNETKYKVDIFEFRSRCLGLEMNLFIKQIFKIIKITFFSL